jgi:hypothetical protein
MDDERDRPAGDARGTVAPVLPLALLESIRDHDRPGEVLEDEDLSASLPRRLGLTGVVEGQIHKYEQAYRRGRRVPAAEVLNLMRLLLRRPDAEEILRQAGHQIARRHFHGVPGAWVGMLRLLPRRMAFISIRRSARRMLRRIVGAGEVHVVGRPLSLRAANLLGASGDEADAVAHVCTGALEELVELYLHERATLRREPGDGRPGLVWEWSLAD